MTRDANRLTAPEPRHGTREVSPLRGLSIAVPAQLRLQVDTEQIDVGWEQLPESTQAAALRVLAGLISDALAASQEGDGG